MHETHAKDKISHLRHQTPSIDRPAIPPANTTVANQPKPTFYEICVAQNTRKTFVQEIPHADDAFMFQPAQTVHSKRGLDRVLALFRSTKAPPNRLIYALAGRIFHPSSPIPFGGARSAPGYLAFTGSNAESLAAFIISETYRITLVIRNRIVMDFVSLHINAVLELQVRGCKDELDEWMLKGLKRAGHIEWFGAHYIPHRLRHIGESDGGGVVPYSVEFCVHRRPRRAE
ncbi:hypothetical protein BDR26DRAFT_916626 [Obelidium mucronatum]|nr:hypothetical protein BDR26DRAFT_916626 [Obelidium mucronatum]